VKGNIFCDKKPIKLQLLFSVDILSLQTIASQALRKGSSMLFADMLDWIMVKSEEKLKYLFIDFHMQSPLSKYDMRYMTDIFPDSSGVVRPIFFIPEQSVFWKHWS
jgi:hypothetical protein